MCVYWGGGALCIYGFLQNGMYTWQSVHFGVVKMTVVFPLTVMPAVIVRQRKPYRRKDGTTLYFEGECYIDEDTL